MSPQSISLDPASSTSGCSQTVWPRVLDAALSHGEAYGRLDLGGGHQGQCRVCLGQSDGAAARRPCAVAPCSATRWRSLLTETGYDVTREYYINDAGAQVDVLARSAYLRYREALGETIGEIPPGLYPGDYLKPVGEALAREHGDGAAGARRGTSGFRSSVPRPWP